MESYTILDKSNALLEVNKSKFISLAIPFNDTDDIKVILNEIKKIYPKAKHYVYAYRTLTKMKSSDDQEPKGTAGRPLLELLLKKNLINIALIVVRYYGGTNLGASRLLRTYVNSGVNALNNAHITKI